MLYEVITMWPFVKKRPYNVIANSKETPKAFYISGFDSSPLAPDYDFVLNGQNELFQMGINVIKRLCDKVHLGVNSDAASKMLHGIKGVILNTYEGPP